MTADKNPFSPHDCDRYALWDMLVRRDIEAFIAQDWSMVEKDFIAEGFMAIDAHRSDNPDSWRLGYPALDHYRRSWLAQSHEFMTKQAVSDPGEALYRATVLRDIEIEGSTAVAHKKFDGQIPVVDGQSLELRFQTLYFCRRLGDLWKIVGFLGYLPNPMGRQPGVITRVKGVSKTVPEGASQHINAGPYSPVLQVSPGALVVISGQAAIDMQGNIVGETIEEQTKITLTNCNRQLAAAGCTFADVFKVTAYLTDLKDWGRFNSVYQAVIPEPRPVRTVVQAGLLPRLLVEVEMWAVKQS